MAAKVPVYSVLNGSLSIVIADQNKKILPKPKTAAAAACGGCTMINGSIAIILSGVKPAKSQPKATTSKACCEQSAEVTMVNGSLSIVLKDSKGKILPKVTYPKVVSAPCAASPKACPAADAAAGSGTGVTMINGSIAIILSGQPKSTGSRCLAPSATGKYQMVNGSLAIVLKGC